ncbi:uncharacterized protein LOC106661869 [Cimex lectularius]|uniref:Uncharacterized protein n=1 Tax=Cimex lectularius TaxID=79782 RepID=A0A8I6REN5_CIMLE|nr:uncharacterized protein LOC106661869 [Cimex lectularius]
MSRYQKLGNAMRIIIICLLMGPLVSQGNVEPVPVAHLTPPKQTNERPPRSPTPQHGTVQQPTDGNGLLSFTQKIASWFWPGASHVEVNQAKPEARGKAETSATEPRGVWADGGKRQKPHCSPCNSVPWLPIARAVGHFPQAPVGDSHLYSLQIPTIGVNAYPHNQLGPPKPHYGPPKPAYGPPKPAYGPPKPEYGPPKLEYGPPKPEYGPPKPEYGPPKPEYGPPKPEYGPPKPAYGPPKPEYGPPPTLDFGPPKHEFIPPKPEYGPPKPEYGPPKPEYGPPKPEYGPPPTLDFGPPKLEYGPPKPEYGPPKPEYGPPEGQNSPPSSDYGPPKQDLVHDHLHHSSFDLGLQPPKADSNHGWDSHSADSGPKPSFGVPNNFQGHPHSFKLIHPHGPAKHPGYLPPPPKYRQHPPRFTYLPPKPMFVPKPVHSPPVPPTGLEHQPAARPPPPPPTSHPSVPSSLSYRQFLSPPPAHPSEAYQSLNYHTLQNPTPSPVNVEHNSNQQHNFAYPVTAGQNSCSKCPPTGPDLSQVHANDHYVTGPEEAKNIVANFANVPLSDSAHEATNLASSPAPGVVIVTPKNEVEVAKSVPIREYLSSVEYPMQIVQAPILDVPDLPKYFDFGYHSFNHGERQNKNYQADTQAPASFTTPQPASVTHNHFQRQTGFQGVQQPVFHQREENSTIYETNPHADRAHTAASSSTTWIATPRPFNQPSPEAKPNRTKIHQIIVPYSTQDNPPLARKVPSDPVAYPDVQAIYLNRGVTAPEGGITNINYPLTATGSEHHDTLLGTDSDLLNSLPPDIMNHLLQMGIKLPEDSEKGRLQQVLASDIRALLHGEEDTVDFARLQKNIDKWTAEGYGKRDTVLHQISKQIPDDYLTTPKPTDQLMPESDHEAAASQHYSHDHQEVRIDSKTTNTVLPENDTKIIEEVSGWSLVDTVVTTENSRTTTVKPWEKLEVSISPHTNEKVYVVTPQAYFPTGAENNSLAESKPTTSPDNGQRVTRDIIIDGSTSKVDIVTPESITETTDKTIQKGSPEDPIVSEVPASVTYLGSASSLRNSKLTFSTIR